MKKLSLAALTLMALFSVQSALANYEKEYHFVFEFRQNEELAARAPKALQKYEYHVSAQSYEEAFTQAAKACYSHFKDGRHLTENQGLDIIDTCANPKG